MSIGERIKSIRKLNGMTQAELGKRCGMPDSQIGSYERGEYKPTLPTLERIAKGLGVSVKEIEE